MHACVRPESLLLSDPMMMDIRLAHTKRRTANERQVLTHQVGSAKGDFSTTE